MADLAVPSISPARRGLRDALRVSRNPVVLKELRGRMRGARAFLLLTFHLLAMSGFVLLLHTLYQASANNSPYTTFTAPLLGKYLFGGLVIIELMLACFITPAITAGAISGERERQTYDLLRTTLLPARSIILGKLASALVFILLLLLAGLPLQNLSFLLGGVAPEEVLIASALLIATAFLFGAAGLFFSSFMRRTLGATVLSYAFALLSTLGLPLLLLPLLGLGPVLNFGTPRLLVQILLTYGFGLLVALNPLATAMATEIILVNQHSTFYFTQTLYSPSGRSIVIPLISPWLPYVLFCFGLGALLILFSIWKVQRVER
ncbi:MAG: ABC transporter permease [Anaerolineales bacterium]